MSSLLKKEVKVIRFERGSKSTLIKNNQLLNDFLINEVFNWEIKQQHLVKINKLNYFSYVFSFLDNYEYLVITKDNTFWLDKKMTKENVISAFDLDNPKIKQFFSYRNENWRDTKFKKEIYLEFGQEI